MDLWASAQSGNLAELAAAVDENPGQLNQAGPGGWQPLHLAAHFGHAECVRYLLASGADPMARSANSLDNLAIHAAAAGKHTAIVEMLLDAGTPVDATQHGGFTALHAAAHSGLQDMVELLLRRGADPSILTADGRTAASYAQENNHTEIVQRLSR
jgi:ankyrin repeat protein